MSGFYINPAGMLQQDAVWTDRRLLNVYHNFYAFESRIPKSKKEHQARKQEIIRRLKLSAGLLPEFKIPQNQPRITNRHIYQGVAIYDVEIETLPGLKLAGSLFMPENLNSKAPAVLCPHGHGKGRIAPTVASCSFQLARLGFITFSYDMIGFNNNNDFPHEFPPSLRKKGDFYGISPFGLQTMNSLRAVDFIASLPEVDPERIGCTGGSGGASQTWFIGLLDDRVKALAPACMLSCHFQGGCTCEEGPLLRTGGMTSFDIVSCLAPRPLLIVSVDGDWTNHVPAYEFPGIKQVYSLYNAADQAECVYDADNHNYNKRTRQYIYNFFLRTLAGKTAPNVEEADIPQPPPEKLWHGGQEPGPATPETIRRAFGKLKRFFVIHSIPPEEEGKRLLSEMVSDGFQTKDIAERVAFARWPISGGMIFSKIISRRGVGDRINALRIVPGHTEDMPGGGKPTARTGYLLIAPDSLKGMNENPELGTLVAELTERGVPGMIMELLGSGISAADLKRSVRNFKSPTDLTFNPSLYSMRVQDIRTVYTMLRERGFEKVIILSAPETALAVLAAAALLPEADAVCDLRNVREQDFYQQFNYQPLIGRIGGISGLIRLASRPGVFFVNAGKYAGEIRDHHGVISSEDFTGTVKKYNWLS